MRAIASRLPGIGRHSPGLLMNWSLSWLMTPSRSRITSFAERAMRADLYREARDVGDAVHGRRDAAQQREAVAAHRGIVVHHHHVVEETVDRRLGRRERRERAREIAGRARIVDHRAEPLE